MKVPDPLRATLRRQPHADLAVAAVVLAVTLVTTAPGPSSRPLTPVAALTAAIACAVLVARHRYPHATLAISLVAAELYLAQFRGDGGSFVVVAPLIALYSVAERASSRRGVIIGVVAVLALGALHIAVKPASWLGAENVALAALGSLAVAVGAAARTRRAYVEVVEARVRDAEADRDAEAARQVTEERLRIARDLHDLLGHHLAVIYVQAGVAEHVLTEPPERAADALAHIRSASKAALGGLGDTIGLLRTPDEPAAPTEPTAGLAGLDALLTSFRRSGLRIEEHVEGDAGPLPVAADLVAYRVIQESLTNVCKHAGPATVQLRLAYGPDALRIVVDNASSPPRAPLAPGGHGLLGMRERVGALGGRLRAGPRPDGGYRVSAELPLPAP
jgi:signal transduction histidine kinase